MTEYDRDRRSTGGSSGGGASSLGTPGKRSLVESRYGVQRKARAPSDGGAGATADVAARGVDGPGERLPFLDVIQQASGRDLGGIDAHVGGPAADACAELGATAYATGSKVAFASQPDLHTATHEATHVLQQGAGVQLKGGVGQVGDEYERQADAAGDAIVRGESIAQHMPTGGNLAASAGVQMQKDGGGKPKTAKGTTPLVVHVFHKNGSVTTWRGVTDLEDLKGHAFYGGKGDDGDWSWNSALGDEIDLYKDENDRTPTPITALSSRPSVEFISIHIGAKDFPIPDGKEVAELSGVSKKKNAKKRTGPVDPDRALFGDDDTPADSSHAKADPSGAKGGQVDGVTDATGKRHRTGGGQQITGDAKPDDSRGADQDAVATGDSQGQRHDIIPDDSGADAGRKTGPRGGATGNTQDTGKANGSRDGHDGDRASIVHNPNAELAPGPGGNIPEDGGNRDGLAGGEQGGRKGGVPGALGIWGLFTMSATMATTVHLGQVLADADIAGAADALISAASAQIAKRLAKRALKKELKKLARERLTTIVEDAMETLETRLADVPDWVQLDEAAKKQLRARWKYELSDEAPKALKRHLKQRIAALDEVVGDGEYMARELGTDEFLDDMVAGYRAERDALKDVEDAIDVSPPKQGKGSFRDFNEKYMDDVEAAGEWAKASSYWPKTKTHNGMKVYQRDDLFDPELVVNGESNLQRMQRGRAPVGHDSNPVELHHLNQANEGPVVEIEASFHDAHTGAIHINDHTIPSGIDRPGFDTWKKGYWKTRAKELAQ